MNKLFLNVIASITFGCLLLSNCYANIPPTPSLAPMLQNIIPAIVNIRAQIKITDLATLSKLQQERAKNENNPTEIPDKALSVASGVIVDANKGYILTNAHVVDGAETVTITLGDGRHYTAKIIGMDKPSDVALLQIKAKNLTAIQMSDSNQLKVGDFVAAIGNPFGLNSTVTSGIVSALGRTTLGIENYENFIQTDASINPGNSGGALINTQGQLVGINTAILAPAQGNVGIGFAIPSNMAKSVMMQLIEYGNVKRGALGVGAQDISPELANALSLSINKGAAVTQVMHNSPAEKAGLQVGDIIVSINGSDVKNANDVVNAIAFLRVDSKTTINVLRNNKIIPLSVTLMDPKQRQLINAEADPFLFGLSLRNFSQSSPIHGNVQGVLVVSLDQDTNAWRADLLPGDVIISANQQKVSNIDELRAAAAKADKTLVLNVLRGPGAVFLVISKEQ